MKIAVINGDNINSIERIHNKLKYQLDFSDYYGMNLDSLWDELTSTSEEIKIIIKNADKLIDSLGNYGVMFRHTIREASEENDKIHVEIDD